MRTGSLLCLQSTEGLAPLGAFNQPVHRSYQQIRAALANELGPRYADYFARPDVDGDGHRIGWVASSIGDPHRWVDMPPAEQQRLEPVKREIQAGFDAYRSRLDAAAENSPQNNFGKVLAQAIRVPSPEYLYFINDQPVLAFWGFKTTTARDGIDPLRLVPGGMTLPTGGAVPPIAPALVAPVVAEVAGGRRWKWWWWLLLLLLLLVLLLALWWWWHRPVTLGGFVAPATEQHETTTPVVPVAPTPPGTTTLPQATAPGAVVPGTGGGAAGEGTLPNGGGTMPLGPDGAAGNKGTGTSPSDQSASPPQDQTPSTNPQDQQNPGQKTPDQQKPSPPTQNPQQNPQQQATIPPNLPDLPKPGETVPAKPMTLPSDMHPGPANFMSGTWQSRSGLQVDGKPAEELYRFNEQGQGDITLRTRDGSITCHAPAQATVGPDGRLSIKETPSLGCSNGSSVPGAVTECTGGAQASCVGTNESDGSKFSVQMQSLGQK